MGDRRPFSGRVFAGVVLVAMLLMAPSLIWGPPVLDSGAFNYSWTQQFGEALARGEFYPRFLPGSYSGFGSPAFYFYPPIAFYVSGGLHTLGLSVEQAINGAALVAMLACRLTMSTWLRFKGLSPWWALLYMAGPYHLTDWYYRAALAEFASYAWLPLIALAIEAQPRRWAMPLLAVSLAGLTMTHLPMAVLASVALIMPMVLTRRRFIAAYAVAGTIGLGMSAIYLLPALTLQDRVSMAAVMWSGLYDASSWAPWGPQDTAWIWPLALAPCALALGRRTFWSVLTLVGAAMALTLVPFVWDLPILRQVQFPWRLLALVEFSAVTAVAVHKPKSALAAIAGHWRSFPFTGPSNTVTLPCCAIRRKTGPKRCQTRPNTFPLGRRSERSAFRTRRSFAIRRRTSSPPISRPRPLGGSG